MIKRTLLIVLFALQFAGVLSQGLAYVPEPSCFPCPDATISVR